MGPIEGLWGSIVAIFVLVGIYLTLVYVFGVLS